MIFKISLIVFLWWIALVGCNNSTGHKLRMNNTEDNLYYLNPYFKEGKNDVTYYASKELTNAQKHLLQKVVKLAIVNEKTASFFDEIKKSGTAIFSSEIGITRKEFENVVQIFTYDEPSEKKGVIEIRRDKDYFEIKGVGQLRLFDSLQINTKDSIALYKKIDLQIPKDSFNLSYDNIPTGEHLDSVLFLKGPVGIAGLIDINGTYELIIGRLKPSGRTYLSFYADPPIVQALETSEPRIPRYCTMIIENSNQ